MVDVTSPDGAPDAVRFAGNLLSRPQERVGRRGIGRCRARLLPSWGHPFGYTDAIWSKYGKTIDPKATPPPAANPYNSGEQAQLAALAEARRAVHGVRTASRGLAGRIAGPGGNVDAILAEMGANLIPSARIVPAGVVAVVHAQERRFALVSVG